MVGQLGGFLRRERRSVEVALAQVVASSFDYLLVGLSPFVPNPGNLPREACHSGPQGGLGGSFIAECSVSNALTVSNPVYGGAFCTKDALPPLFFPINSPHFRVHALAPPSFLCTLPAGRGEENPRGHGCEAPPYKVVTPNL